MKSCLRLLVLLPASKAATGIADAPANTAPVSMRGTLPANALSQKDRHVVRHQDSGLRTAAVSNSSSRLAGGRIAGKVGGAPGEMPCYCETSNPSWKRCERSTAKCIFIDLGAADGNSFNDFLTNKYGPVQNCPSGGAWEAILIEANPRFAEPLMNLQRAHQTGSLGGVTSMPATAAWMCKGNTSFYLDVTNHANNYWASSISSDSNAGKLERINVPTVNVVQLLYENTIPGDWVMVKMDIEGAEWDIMPCFAQAEAASLTDRLYVEVHPASWGITGTDQKEMESAEAKLRRRGVDIPFYYSQTF